MTTVVTIAEPESTVTVARADTIISVAGETTGIAIESEDESTVAVTISEPAPTVTVEEEWVIVGIEERSTEVAIADSVVIQGSTDHGELTGVEDDDHPQYLSKAGGAMTGPLLLPADPTLALHAATKQYVDANAGGNGGGGASDIAELTAAAFLASNYAQWDGLGFVGLSPAAVLADIGAAALVHLHTESDISDLGDYADALHNHDLAYDILGSAAAVQGNLDTHVGDVANPHAVTAAQAGAAPALHDHDLAYDALGSASAVQDLLDAHKLDVANPHGVTAAQAGAAPALHDHDGDYDALGSASAVQSSLDAHKMDTTNPHAVTAAQVGAAALAHLHVEMDITDLDKYTQAEADALLAGKSASGHGHAALDAHIAAIDNPHNVTLAQVGAAAAAHTHTEVDITDLDKYTQAQVDAFLAGKSDTTHTHAGAGVTLGASNDPLLSLVGQELTLSQDVPSIALDETISGEWTFNNDVVVDVGLIKITSDVGYSQILFEDGSDLDVFSLRFSRVGDRLELVSNVTDPIPIIAFSKAGNVGIGTTAPAIYSGIQSNLEVKSTTHGQIAIQSGTSTTVASLSFVNAGAPKWLLLQRGNSAQRFEIFEDTFEARMTILAGGNVGIGTSSPVLPFELHTNYASYAVRFINDGGSSNRRGVVIQAGQDSNPTAVYMGFLDGNGSTAVGTIVGNGGGGVAYNTTSDERIKQDITPLASTLDRVLALSPISYRGKGAPKSARKVTGFTAQAVQPHFPDLVHEEEDGLLSLNYPGFVPHIVRALQELNAKVEALEALRDG